MAGQRALLRVLATLCAAAACRAQAGKLALLVIHHTLLQTGQT